MKPWILPTVKATGRTITQETIDAALEQSEALRDYLAEEEARRRSEELLNQRLNQKIERSADFCI